MKYRFQCLNCQNQITPDPHVITCNESGCNNEVLEIVYTNKNDITSSQYSIPLSKPSNLINLGQGNTPIIKLNTLSKELNLDIFAKLEYMNPTGSFKDRGSSMMISALKEFGINQIVEDSSGNAGASISAYSAYSKITSHIFVPKNAPKNKVAQIELYGSKVYKINGPRDNATKAAIKYSNENSIPYSSHNLSPFFIEGTKSFGYEVISFFKKNQPDHILFPVGNGSLIIGSYNAYKENRDQISIPKHHAIQTENISPIVFENKNIKWKPEDWVPTIANGIAILDPPRKRQSSNIINITNGSAATVSEQEILEWQIKLAECEGIFAEITASAIFAALRNMKLNKIIKNKETILLPITGFGLKDPPPNFS